MTQIRGVNQGHCNALKDEYFIVDENNRINLFSLEANGKEHGIDRGTPWTCDHVKRRHTGTKYINEICEYPVFRINYSRNIPRKVEDSYNDIYKFELHYEYVPKNNALVFE